MEVMQIAGMRILTIDPDEAEPGNHIAAYARMGSESLLDLPNRFERVGGCGGVGTNFHFDGWEPKGGVLNYDHSQLQDGASMPLF